MMEMKYLYRNSKKVQRQNSTGLRRFLAFASLCFTFQNMSPLVSRVHAQETGDQMGEVMKEKHEEKFDVDIARAKQIISDAKPTGRISNENLDELIRIWNEWRTKGLPPAQGKNLMDVFGKDGLTKAGLEFSDEQREKLASAGLLREKKKQVPMPLVGEGETTKKPGLEFFPEVAAIKKRGGIGTPEVTLSSSIRSRMPAEQQPMFSSTVGKGIRTQLEYGKGSDEAKREGEEIARQLKNLPGNLRDILGPRYEDIIAKLKEGDIVGAMKSGNLLEGLKESVRQIRFDKPVALMSLSGESPRYHLLGDETKLYLSGLMALDLLVSEEYKGDYDEETGEVALKSTGTLNPAVVLKAGPKGTIEFMKGMELSLTPSAVLPLGIPESWPARFNLQLGFTDKSGAVTIPWTEIPLYSGAVLEYETPGVLKYRLDVGATVVDSGGWKIMPVIDFTHMPLLHAGVVGEREGQYDIPRPTWTFSPGVKLKKGEHDFGLRYIAGDETQGVGALYTYQKFTFGFDLTRAETKTIGTLPSLGGWFGGITIKGNFGEEVE